MEAMGKSLVTVQVDNGEHLIMINGHPSIFSRGEKGGVTQLSVFWPRL